MPAGGAGAIDPRGSRIAERTAQGLQLRWSQQCLQLQRHRQKVRIAMGASLLGHSGQESPE